MNKCDFCKKLFTGARDLKRHIHTIHEGKKDYKCEVCSKSFSQGGDLKKHIHTVHDGNKDYKCEACGKLFSESSHLYRHIHRIHDGHKDYKYESCDKSFFQANHLKRHISTLHEGQRCSKCEYCGKLFSDIHSLKTHIKIVHEGQKDYKCELCKKSFAQSGQLKAHILTFHDGQRAYKCDTCGKSFSREVEMRRHIHIIHEGLRYYKCETCGKLFSEIKDLKKHINTNHEGKDHRYEKKIKNHANCLQRRTLLKLSKKLIKRSRNLWQMKNRSLSKAMKKLPSADFKCKKCSKQFTDSEKLYLHNKYIICYAAAQSDSKLVVKKNLQPIIDLNIHYKCNTCSKLIKGRLLLQAHKLHCTASSFENKNNQEEGRSSSTINKKLYKCSICQSEFDMIRDLNQHIKQNHFGSSNETEKYFHCIPCKIDIYQKTDVVGHLGKFLCKFLNVKKH